MKEISPCLWFDCHAEEAAEFYTTLFRNSKMVKVTSSGKVDFEIAGLPLVGQSGGSHHSFNQSCSLFVWCETEQEIDQLWLELSKGGVVNFKLDKYPWAEKYGWTSDRFGMQWQLMLANHKQKISPALMFVGKNFGQGEKALHFYKSVFPNSLINVISKDPVTKTIQFSEFSISDRTFVLMEGPGNHAFEFNEAFSFVLACDSQSEMDLYWKKLSKDGQEGQGGWLKDKFGVSWQIVLSGGNWE